MRFSRLFIIAIAVFLLSYCANPGTSLSGGAKDEKPPVLLSSVPENFSTNFAAEEVVLEFNEFLKPGNPAAKLIISPVMDKKPEVKIKGKELTIKFLTELLPNRTYTLNFGDGIADLNENNPIENFTYVFSTGDEIDSLQISGQVNAAFTNEPAEGVAVMLYQEDIDSLPLTELPIYLSLTDENGQYNLKNLATGSYKLFALKDANSNYLFDQAKEEIAFLDSLITPGARIVENIPEIDSLSQRDSLPLNDSIPASDSLRIADSISPADSISISEFISTKDSITTNLITTDSITTDSLQVLDPASEFIDTSKMVAGDSLSQEQAHDSIPLSEQSEDPEEEIIKVEYFPKNINLKTFTEVYKKQYITSTSRPKANKIEVLFNQTLDSLFITYPSTSTSPSTYPSTYALSLNPYALSYSSTPDTITLHILDSTLYQQDTLEYLFQYTAYDSLEQPFTQIDTVAFSFRATEPKAGEEPVNPFKITSNFNREKELGVANRLSFPEPWKSIDTSKIELYRTRDTLKFKEEFIFAPDTLPPFNVSILEAAEQSDSLAEIPATDSTPVQANTEQARLDLLSLSVLNSFLIDSSYSLTLYPGAFTSYTGLTNDTTKISFKVKNPEKYGTVLLNIEDLTQAAIVQMIKGKDQVIQEVLIDTAGVVNFDYIKPGKYTFKLILDDNKNGKWDTGRYLKGIQPETTLLYDKELDVKANWELEESWKLEEE